MIVKYLALIGFVLTLSHSIVSAGNRLYVTSTGSCPEDGTPCHPVMYYIRNASHFLISDTEMVFQEGPHFLEVTDNSFNVKIENVTNFNMIGNGPVEIHQTDHTTLPSSRIICNGSYGAVFYFLHSNEIRIEGLTFENCGTNVTFYDNFTLQAAVTFREVSDVQIRQVLINNSTGFGLHADKVYGKFVISNSSFLRSNQMNQYYSGNARFWYSNCSTTSETSLTITSSWFMYGNQLEGSEKRMLHASGLIILIYCPSIKVMINDITAEQNRGDNGGNVAISLMDYYANTSTVEITNSRLSNGVSNRGGGLRLWSRINPEYKNVRPSCEPNQTYKQHHIISISDTVFNSNTVFSAGGALYLSHYEIKQIDCVLRMITFNNCNFTNNVNPEEYKSGAALELIKHKIPSYMPHTVPQFSVKFMNCRFTNNTLSTSSRGAIIDLFSIESVEIINCIFENNSGTAISLRSSNIIFNGTVSFINNVAHFGGALKLCDTSIMYIEHNTTVRFINNHALETGGAIYAERRCLETAPPCFFQPIVPENQTNVDSLNKTMMIEFINNTARIAGDAIFGGSIDFCYTYDFFTYKNNKSNFHSKEIYNNIVNMTEQTGQSNVSSDPYGICFCSASEMGYPWYIRNCSKKTLHLAVHPGQTLHIPCIAVGQFNGVVPALISIKVTNDDNSTRLVRKDNQISTRKRLHNKTCQILNYTANSLEPKITLKMILQTSSPSDEGSSYSKFRLPVVDIDFTPCPWGFKLSTKGRCDCHPLFKKHNIINCDIQNKSIQLRSDEKIWVGCSSSLDINNDSEINNNSIATECNLTLIKWCPVGFCSLNHETITQETIDEQCHPHRCGILCGSCQNGYSLALGTSRCIEHCHNSNLIFLLPIFAAAGILLVLVLIVCNLTIADGTIHGLLFYGNIIHANHNIFFPDNISNKNILRIFAAWLSLDFGVEVCFFRGLDSYAKIWFQFGFIFYICAIIALIIIFSRRFIFFTRLIGRNVVKVLATLTLICAAKLIRNILFVVQFSVLTNSNGSNKWVWRYNGNIEYFTGKHIPLYLLAVLLALVGLTFTMALLFVQCLRRQSNWCCLRWVERLRPFFDAFTGPCRDNYHFWPGFLLSLRMCLITLYNSATLSQGGKLYITIAACIIVLVFAWVTPNGVYKKWPVNILEFSFFLNLCLLSGVIAIFQSVDANIFSYVSGGIAFLTFIGILSFHAFRQFKNTDVYQRLSNWRRAQTQGDNNQGVTDESEPLLTQGMPPVVYFNQYREPLIEDD